MKRELRQVVQLAPPGELRAYVLYEHQLDLLAQGQPVAGMLNFALFFLGVAATGFGTVAALPSGQDKVFYTFLTISLVAGVAGVVLFVLWIVTRRPVHDLVADIKRQMPANPEVGHATSSTDVIGGNELHSSGGD